ncbi:SPW repeat protein [Streptacidiphilus melanogenes]|uniref:SPW repeat protein n=1 Tax=Streptacidiphilus melanogenes TaxID=411235 RepID=UPI0005A7423D|nr:SPW repeat protein [Streptacidiphilus melanogenes]
MALVTSTSTRDVVPLKRAVPPRHLWWADLREAVGYPLLLIALFLFSTPALLDYPMTYQAQEAHLNEIMVGIVVFFNGLARLVRTPTRVSDVVVGLSGLWLVIAPFAVGYSHYSEAGRAAVADWVAGGILVLLAVCSAVSLTISERAAPSRE